MEHDEDAFRQRHLFGGGFPALIRRHFAALAGFILIAAACAVAILGYLIMPDKSPNANDGAVQLGKQPPGARAIFLKIAKNSAPEKRSLLGVALYGRENPYLLIPVTSYHIDGLRIQASGYGRTEAQQTYDMREIVTGVSHQPELTTDQAPERESPVRVRYLTGIEQDISYGELLDRFEGDHVETRRYLLGTDRAGRDLLSRLIFGTRISLSIGLAAVAISLFIGIVAGTLAGYFGRITDTVIVWLISVIWSVPGIMLVIAISIALQSRGLWVIFLAVGLTMWVEVARTVRGEMLALREKQYVEAARAFGFSDFRIVFRHIMPNMAGTLVVLATANFASAILLEAGLSFLGLGVQPPTPSWGMMVYEGFQAMGTKNSWHLILFPALAICIMVLAFNLLGSGLRDATDPNTKGKY